MTKDDVAVLAGRIALLPKEARDELAQTIDEIGARHGGVYQLSNEESVAVEEGLAQAARGEFASEKEVDAVLRKSWG
jgi:predicted transcriptional regulator